MTYWTLLNWVSPPKSSDEHWTCSPVEGEGRRGEGEEGGRKGEEMMLSMCCYMGLYK